MGNRYYYNIQLWNVDNTPAPSEVDVAFMKEVYMRDDDAVLYVDENGSANEDGEWGYAEEVVAEVSKLFPQHLVKMYVSDEWDGVTLFFFRNGEYYDEEVERAYPKYDGRFDNGYLQEIVFSSGETITIQVKGEGGTLSTDLWDEVGSDPDDPARAGLEMLTSLLLALACDGVDLTKHDEAIEQAVIAFYQEVD